MPPFFKSHDHVTSQLVFALSIMFTSAASVTPNLTDTLSTQEASQTCTQNAVRRRAHVGGFANMHRMSWNKRPIVITQKFFYWKSHGLRKWKQTAVIWNLSHWWLDKPPINLFGSGNTQTHQSSSAIDQYWELSIIYQIQTKHRYVNFGVPVGAAGKLQLNTYWGSWCVENWTCHCDVLFSATIEGVARVVV